MGTRTPSGYDTETRGKWTPITNKLAAMEKPSPKNSPAASRVQKAKDLDTSTTYQEIDDFYLLWKMA
eukprot:5995090-Prorocentrum_lima.AAC.1